jgi:hypothetical protein
MLSMSSDCAREGLTKQRGNPDCTEFIFGYITCADTPFDHLSDRRQPGDNSQA